MTIYGYVHIWTGPLTLWVSVFCCLSLRCHWSWSRGGCPHTEFYYMNCSCPPVQGSTWRGGGSELCWWLGAAKTTSDASLADLPRVRYVPLLLGGVSLDHTLKFSTGIYIGSMHCDNLFMRCIHNEHLPGGPQRSGSYGRLLQLGGESISLLNVGL